MSGPDLSRGKAFGVLGHSGDKTLYIRNYHAWEIWGKIYHSASSVRRPHVKNIRANNVSEKIPMEKSALAHQ